MQIFIARSKKPLNARFCLIERLGTSVIMFYEVIKVCLTYFKVRAIFFEKN